MLEIPIVLIGHKDHGKSTLIGRLLLDTKSIKESRFKEVQEVDEVSGYKFELAHLVDSFKEEREREMTMDTTRALLKGKKRNYQLIDVPGHAELISNMLTGASAAEAALLMVSIEEGIKEQTRQHLEIAKLLGIEQIGVIVNKIDKVFYQEEKFSELKEKLKDTLNEIGYSSENIYFFPVSAWEGDNVVEKSKKTSWYKGPTVMEFLEKEIKITESLEKLSPVFLAQDKYEELIIGRIERGKIKKSQEVIILPKNRKDKIKSIKDSSGELEEAIAGQNVGIELFNEENKKIDNFRGMVFALEDSGLKTGNKLTGEIFWIESPSQENLILECGTAKTEGIIRMPDLASPGQKTSYEFKGEKPITFEPKGKTILGKLVLKDKGKIIAVGNIL